MWIVPQPVQAQPPSARHKLPVPSVTLQLPISQRGCSSHLINRAVLSMLIQNADQKIAALDARASQEPNRRQAFELHKASLLLYKRLLQGEALEFPKIATWEAAYDAYALADHISDGMAEIEQELRKRNETLETDSASGNGRKLRAFGELLQAGFFLEQIQTLFREALEIDLRHWTPDETLTTEIKLSSEDENDDGF